MAPPLPLLTLAAALAWALAAPAAAAESDPWALCGAERGFGWEADADLEGAPELSADRFDVSEQDRYRLEGGVELREGGRWLAADRLSYQHSSTEYQAEGGVRYLDPSIALTAEAAQGATAERRSDLSAVEYRLRGVRGNGEAERARLHGELAELEGLSYSTCNPGDQAWQLRARELRIDRAAGVGSARNASLRIANVPVLWLPYVTFPIDERRRSGLLFPSFGYDNDSGIDLRVPYYLNLAPNVDATLTPRLIGRRGAMFGAELRYLGADSSGQLEGDYLADDDLSGSDRGALRFRHQGRLSDYWDLRADLNHVSDDRYFEDFGDSLAARSTSLLASYAGLYGQGPGWRGSLRAQQWDITDPFLNDSAEPYRQLPRAQFLLGRNSSAGFRYGLLADAVAFAHSSSGAASRFTRGDALRYDLQPWIEWPLEAAAGYLRPRLGYRYTGYQLGDDWLRSLEQCTTLNCGNPSAVFPNRSPSRALPIASVDAALNFERQSGWFGGGIQTLQPRLYYLRVPFEAQDDLPLFDTQPLTFGFDQLFRSNRFSGADRQGDANQLTLALASRWFDAGGEERLALSLGQIRHFDDRRVQLLPGDAVDERHRSATVAGIDLRLNDSLRLGYAQQWAAGNEQTLQSGLRLGWQNQHGALANLAYRYRRGQLEQVDASFAIPLGDAWRWVGRWNYSLFDEGTLESFAGFEWQDCCVAWRVLGRHYVRNREGDMGNALYIELELKGLASLGRDTGEFLERAILGYSR